MSILKNEELSCAVTKGLITKIVEFYRKGDYVIKRDKYLKQLIKNQNNGFPKVITGTRRCGKSYLLNTIFKQYLLDSGIDENDFTIIGISDFLLRFIK